MRATARVHDLFDIVRATERTHARSRSHLRRFFDLVCYTTLALCFVNAVCLAAERGSAL